MAIIISRFTTLCYSFQISNTPLHLDLLYSHRSAGQLHSQQISNDETRIKGPKITPKKERPRIPVLQYHDNWVCVNKPAGMTVHRSGRTPKNQLVLCTLLKRQLARKVYPVHRLDHRTSGAILFAFNSETCGLLHKALTANEEECENYDHVESSRMGSKKNYIALLRGDWRRKFGEEEVVIVDKPLDVKGETKEARTEFHLLASTSSGNSTELYCPSACSLVLCIPKTGRTHQIRRHAFSIGFPVIGDYQHGDTKLNRWWRENRGLDRLFLHCLAVDLPALSTFDPVKSSDKRIICTAPLPKELVNVLERDDMIDLWSQAKEKDPRLSLEPLDEKGGTFGRNYKSRNR